MLCLQFTIIPNLLGCSILSRQLSIILLDYNLPPRRKKKSEKMYDIKNYTIMNAYTFNFNTIHLLPICKPFLAFSFQQK